MHQPRVSPSDRGRRAADRPRCRRPGRSPERLRQRREETRRGGAIGELDGEGRGANGERRGVGAPEDERLQVDAVVGEARQMDEDARVPEHEGKQHQRGPA